MRAFRSPSAHAAKVLIFSQMVKMLDLLEEYCEAKRYHCERLDGRVAGKVRVPGIGRRVVRREVVRVPGIGRSVVRREVVRVPGIGRSVVDTKGSGAKTRHC